MGAAGYQKAICLLSLASLIHCGYSAAQHRSFLRLTDQEFTSLPLDILIQTIVSLVILCWSGGGVAGELQSIRADVAMRSKSWDAVGSCPGFMSFHHRAKALSPYFSMPIRPSSHATTSSQHSSDSLLTEE